MKEPRRDQLWAAHDAALRQPEDIVAFWEGAPAPDPRLLRCQTRGRWWETLAEKRITLLVTREYEHLLMALSAGESGSSATFLRLPHPSGLVADRQRRRVYVASTRNPNQIYVLRPAAAPPAERPLMPAAAWFFPGRLYLHDLALIGGALYGNSVGQNAVVRLRPSGEHERAWWPRCIEIDDQPRFARNHLQLNSIAAGASLEDSFFSASTDEVGESVPGDADFAVDRRGVIFSGRSRQVIARGLTRPHSARLHGDALWVDNSGYGEVGVVEAGGFRAVHRLCGWTRGLAFCDDVMFVGTSRVLPRFRQYAPGLEVETSECGVHAIDLASGEILGSIVWPFGNQIFAIDWTPVEMTRALPFRTDEEPSSQRRVGLFYGFDLEASGNDSAEEDSN